MRANSSFKNLISLFITILFSFLTLAYFYKPQNALAMPFYDLNPQELVLRSKFYTSFSSSSEERKHNISLASTALNKTFVDAGAEFSFNLTVGARTVERGYKTAKIIVGGEFTDGVGGGVCQVSTTLYNAILLSGLKITEYHPHSLPVSYVAPSFDAMVSFGFADLKFINDTHNPLIIYTTVTSNTVTVEIYGEPSPYTYYRQSVVTEQIPAPPEQEIDDIKGEYPELYEGQKKVIRYSKTGLKSQAYIVTLKNGKPVYTKKIRSDSYSATRGLIVCGKTPYPLEIEKENLYIYE